MQLPAAALCSAVQAVNWVDTTAASSHHHGLHSIQECTLGGRVGLSPAQTPGAVVACSSAFWRNMLRCRPPAIEHPVPAMQAADAHHESLAHMGVPHLSGAGAGSEPSRYTEAPPQSVWLCTLAAENSAPAATLSGPATPRAASSAEPTNSNSWLRLASWYVLLTEVSSSGLPSSSCRMREAAGLQH